MMKLSLMTFMCEMVLLMGGASKEEIQIEVEKILSDTHDAGFTLVDMTEKMIHEVGEEKLQEFLNEYQLALNCLICMADFASNRADDEEIQQEVVQCLEMASHFGTKLLMLVPAGEADGTKEEMGKNLIRRFSRAVGIAEKYGITCVIEDDPKRNIPMCSRQELLKLVEEVPGIKIVYDTANVIMAGEDPIEDFEELKDHIVHMHLKDIGKPSASALFIDKADDGEAYMCVSHGKGIVDLSGVINAAGKSGYEGTMAIEYMPNPDLDRKEDLAEIYQMFCARD